MDDDRAAVALRWCVDLFDRCGAEFQVVGGLAARAYGASRPLVDLDFYVSSARYTDVIRAAGARCIWGPRAHRGEHWDLTFAKLRHKGVPIELGDPADARYFDRVRDEWVEQAVDFARSEIRELLGIPVSVMPREQLIEYKRGLDRDVDRLDLEQMTDSRSDG